jgi:hypothetical protein
MQRRFRDRRRRLACATIILEKACWNWLPNSELKWPGVSRSHGRGRQVDGGKRVTGQPRFGGDRCCSERRSWYAAAERGLSGAITRDRI